ncbi:MAG TPA: hypothetical protein DC049_04130 [Spirochaetia bacterium]|nr:hypothetical protein [Spirochaetia bacterium]
MRKTKPDKNRLLAALNHQKYDRVPNFEIVIDQRSLSYFLGKKIECSFEQLDPALKLDFCQKTGQDAVACNITPWYGKGFVECAKDFNKIKFPDQNIWIEKIKNSEKTLSKADIGLCLRFGGPLTRTYMACGPVPIESFMYLLYDDYELVEKMMKAFTAYTLDTLQAVKKLNFDFFYIGDDLSSSTGPLISPEHIEKLWAPCYEQIINSMKSFNKPVICHCCGALQPVLPYFKKWKVNAVHPYSRRPIIFMKFTENTEKI